VKAILCYGDSNTWGSDPETKERFGGSASDIAQGAASLADMMLRSGCGPGGGAPVALLISPPPVATLTELAKEGRIDRSVLKQAVDRYQLLDVAAADPGPAGGDA